MSEEIVPFLYRRTDRLGLLGLLALCRINNLRIINALRWGKSTPRNQLTDLRAKLYQSTGFSRDHFASCVPSLLSLV